MRCRAASRWVLLPTPDRDRHLASIHRGHFSAELAADAVEDHHRIAGLQTQHARGVHRITVGKPDAIASHGSGRQEKPVHGIAIGRG
jgi:hypothetical protein